MSKWVQDYVIENPSDACNEIERLQARVAQQELLLAEARGHNGAGVGDKPHAVHPDYGPCDAFADGGACSMCVELLSLARSSDQRREQLLRDCGDLVDAIQSLSGKTLLNPDSSSLESGDYEAGANRAFEDAAGLVDPELAARIRAELGDAG